jgi:hypothetical protein
MKTEAARYFMEETRKQISINPNKAVEFPTEIAPLRNASVSWVQKAYAHFKARPELVLQVSVHLF